MNQEKIRKFWEERGRKKAVNGSFSLTNLETDSALEHKKVLAERKKVDSFLDIDGSDRILDLGCGTGSWSFYFAGRAGFIVGVDYCEPMIEKAKAQARKDGFENISFKQSEVCEYRANTTFTIVFISGLILYLDDQSLSKLLKNVRGCTGPKARLFLREPAGIPERYEIRNKWSPALGANYSATYRTRSELIKTVENYDFKLKRDSDMFAKGSELNKYENTRLRIYEFNKINYIE